MGKEANKEIRDSKSRVAGRKRSGNRSKHRAEVTKAQFIRAIKRFPKIGAMDWSFRGGFFNEELMRRSYFVALHLKNNFHFHLPSNLDLSCFKDLRKFLGRRLFDVVTERFDSGHSGFSIRRESGRALLIINEELEDEIKIVVTLHEWIESFVRYAPETFGESGVRGTALDIFEKIKRITAKRLREGKGLASAKECLKWLREYWVVEYAVWFVCYDLIRESKLSIESKFGLVWSVLIKQSDVMMSLMLLETHVSGLSKQSGNKVKHTSAVNWHVADERFENIAVLQGFAPVLLAASIVDFMEPGKNNLAKISKILQKDCYYNLLHGKDDLKGKRKRISGE